MSESLSSEDCTTESKLVGYYTQLPTFSMDHLELERASIPDPRHPSEHSKSSIKLSKPLSVYEEMTDLRQAERPKQKVAATGDRVLSNTANKSTKQHLAVQASSSGVIGVASESRINLKWEHLDASGCQCEVAAAMSFKKSS